MEEKRIRELYHNLNTNILPGIDRLYVLIAFVLSTTGVVTIYFDKQELDNGYLMTFAGLTLILVYQLYHNVYLPKQLKKLTIIEDIDYFKSKTYKNTSEDFYIYIKQEEDKFFIYDDISLGNNSYDYNIKLYGNDRIDIVVYNITKRRFYSEADIQDEISKKKQGK